jgi:2-polyprenyl-3-methyl-5-hydroxy-6-metoxy-1,4-benzoquinol methylase
MLPFVPERSRRILEVGCAHGEFIGRIDAEERWGVEPDGHAADIARSRLTRVLQGRYDDVSSEIPDGHFDVVVCNDVIEHMPDHDAFLQSIQTKIAPGGVLVGSIPNIRALTVLTKLLVLKDFSYTAEGILDRTHLRFFTRKSLLRCLASNGYVVEAMQGLHSIVRHGLRRHDQPLANGLARIGAAAVVAASLGYWSDTQYIQFGFRARPTTKAHSR